MASEKGQFHAMRPFSLHLKHLTSVDARVSLELLGFACRDTVDGGEADEQIRAVYSD